MKEKSKALQAGKSWENSHHQTSSPTNAKGSSLRQETQKGCLNSNPKQQSKWQQDQTSLFTLNVNGLNSPTKRQSLAEWIQKQDPYTCCLQETHLETRDTYRLKVKGWKKISNANRDQKKAGVAILISDTIDFKTKPVKRDEGNYIMIKRSIQEEDITIVNIYAPNTGGPQYVRQMLTSMKGEINNNNNSGRL